MQRSACEKSHYGDRIMKKIFLQLTILIVVALILSPVSAVGQNTSNSTIVPTTMVTGEVSTVTTQVSPNTTTTSVPVNVTTTVLPTTTTLLPVTTTAPVPSTSVTTAVPVSQDTQATVGNITVASSPLGASILIDGVYYGTTPGDFTGIPTGNHIVRLALSGYYDYEGTMYVVPGQETSVFGTLPPLTGYYTQPPTQPANPVPTPTTVPAETVKLTPTQTSSGGALENPTIIAAIIGVITACIGAGATLYPHLSKMKKE
jgi:hypothetical protein